jgi:proteic killer suppression protein
MHKRIFARLDRLDVAVRAEEMNVQASTFIPCTASIRSAIPSTSGPWCITFEFEDGEACRVDFEQCH